MGEQARLQLVFRDFFLSDSPFKEPPLDCRDEQAHIPQPGKPFDRNQLYQNGRKRPLDKLVQEVLEEREKLSRQAWKGFGGKELFRSNVIEVVILPEKGSVPTTLAREPVEAARH